MIRYYNGLKYRNLPKLRAFPPFGEIRCAS